MHKVSLFSLLFLISFLNSAQIYAQSEPSRAELLAAPRVLPPKTTPETQADLKKEPKYEPWVIEYYPIGQQADIPKPAPKPKRTTHTKPPQDSLSPPPLPPAAYQETTTEAISSSQTTISPAPAPKVKKDGKQYQVQGTAGPSVTAVPVKGIEAAELTPPPSHSEKKTDYLSGLNIGQSVSTPTAQDTQPIIKRAESLDPTAPNLLPNQELKMPAIPTIPLSPLVKPEAKTTEEDDFASDIIDIFKDKKPQDSIEITTPTLADLVLTFQGHEDTLSYDNISKLNKIAEVLKKRPARHLHLHSYAQSADGDEGKARSLSLSRGLMVREYLMKQEIRPSQIKVKAFGSRSERMPLDRIDLIFADQ